MSLRDGGSAKPYLVSALLLSWLYLGKLFCLAVSGAVQETREEDEAGRVQLFQGKSPSPG